MNKLDTERTTGTITRVLVSPLSGRFAYVALNPNKLDKKNGLIFDKEFPAQLQPGDIVQGEINPMDDAMKQVTVLTEPMFRAKPPHQANSKPAIDPQP